MLSIKSRLIPTRTKLKLLFKPTLRLTPVLIRGRFKKRKQTYKIILRNSKRQDSRTNLLIWLRRSLNLCKESKWVQICKARLLQTSMIFPVHKLRDKKIGNSQLKLTTRLRSTSPRYTPIILQIVKNIRVNQHRSTDLSLEMVSRRVTIKKTSVRLARSKH